MCIYIYMGNERFTMKNGGIIGSSWRDRGNGMMVILAK